MEKLRQKIREIENWPKEGVNFKDITTLLQDKDGFREMIDAMVKMSDNVHIDKVLGIDARGFIVASPVAYLRNAGLVIVRKPGKLPHETIEEEYTLEYGSNKIQIHRDAIVPGEKVLLVDDLIATGGTAMAACNLVEQLGGEIVGACFVVDLPFLSGAQKLRDRGYEVKSLIQYDSE